MSEARLFVGLVFAVLAWAVFVVCYRWGGWRWKPARRFVGGLVFPAALCGIALWCGTFRWAMLGGLLTYPAWLCLGYGGASAYEKARRRALYGLASGLAAAPFLIPLGLWGILALQTALNVAVCLYYGLRNPISATGEEGTLGGALVVLVVFSVVGSA